jgi:hypothetical protein
MNRHQLINNQEWLEGLREHVTIQRGKYHSDKVYAESIGILPCYVSLLFNKKWDGLSKPMRIRIAEQTGYDKENLRRILADAPEQNIDYFLDPHNFKREDKTASKELTEEVQEVHKDADTDYGIDFPYGPHYNMDLSDTNMPDKTVCGRIERAIETPSEEQENRPYNKPCAKPTKDLVINPVQEDTGKSFSKPVTVAKDIQLINNYLQCREVIDLLPEDKRGRHIQVLLNDLVSELHGVV